jgi:trehalose/maltose hydrolase-like predicted phosphorylase
MDALKSDYVDIQGGTTKEGIHTGVMAGTAVLALRSYVGLNLDGEQIGLNPRLPPAWRQVSFNIGFKGDRYYFVLTPESVKAKVDSESRETLDILVRGRRVTIAPQKWEAIELKGGS